MIIPDLFIYYYLFKYLTLKLKGKAYRSIK